MLKQATTQDLTMPVGASDRFINPDGILKMIGLKAGMQAAHFGCGNGYFTFSAARILGEMGRIWAIDVQKGILDQIKKEARLENLPNVQTVWSDLEIVGATNIANQSLDIIFMINVLFQIKAKRSFFEEAKRLLKSGGSILVVDWRAEKTRFGPILEARVSLDELREVARDTGFAEKSTFEAGKYHYGALFVKKGSH